MDKADLRDQLSRLGLVRGAAVLQPRPPAKARPIETLLPGEVRHTEQGPFFLYRESHPLDSRHGAHRLGDLLGQSPDSAAWLARDPRLGGVEFQRLAFIDTETTGLAGGSGTYAFPPVLYARFR